MHATLEITAPTENPAMLSSPKRRILLVDDDFTNRQTLHRLLTDEGFLVVTAVTAHEAVELAKTMTLDLVLVDLNMPIKDGWNVSEQLSARTPLLPIIVITTYPGDFFPATTLGVSALLEKPLNFTKLISTIQMVLDEPAELRLARRRLHTSIFCYIPSNV